MKNGFTPLDDIRNQMDMYGANGLESELLNADALDESVSNLVCQDYNYGFVGGMGWANYKGKVKAIVKAPKVVKTDKGYFRQGFFPKGTEKNVVDFQKITFYCPFLKRNVTKMMLIFDDGTASVHRRWDKISKFSGFTNESLLDGLTENTSLLNAEGDYEVDYSSLTNESLLDGLTENTSLLSANGETDKKEVKILGMTPTTFGMVAGGAILVIGIVAITMKK